MSGRNVGGSILPSNSAQILAARQTRYGTLQTRILADEDTHGLFLDDALLAKHPNGFSCSALADRLISGNRAAEQADYIVACGGVVTEAGREALKTFAAVPA